MLETAGADEEAEEEVGVDEDDNENRPNKPLRLLLSGSLLVTISN